MRPTSRKWICDKVIEWLREDASVGPKELQRRIHHKYKVLVDYKRVFVGKELALTILCGSCEDSSISCSVSRQKLRDQALVVL